MKVEGNLQRGSDLADAFGNDPWTRTVLSADHVCANSTSFATISDGTRSLTYTPPANSNWMIEAELLIWTTSAANLPRIGVNVAAGATAGYGSCLLSQAGATVNAAHVTANGGWNNPGAVQNFQTAAGGVLAASVPYLCAVQVKGKSGSAPTAISLQAACEIAAASTCIVKAGSEMRTRSGF